MKKWLSPALVLWFLPKCPGCIAAYVGLTTGFGVSFTTAAYIRDALLAICITSLVYWAATIATTSRPRSRNRVGCTLHGDLH
jgi:hypothetical protein